MAKKFIDTVALAGQLSDKRDTLGKIDLLISREKRAECLKNFKVARDILVKEIETLSKSLKKATKSSIMKKLLKA